MIVLFAVALVATLFLFAMLGNHFWLNLWRDVRGVLPAGMVGNALAERGGGVCNMPRIPTGAYPAYSTTIGGVLDAGGNAVVNFEAERDTLFIGISVEVADAAPASATISMTYCNTKYMVQSDVRQWVRCCDRKPIFGVGVAENKKLEFSINGGTPAGAFSITMHGFQGRGCCP